MIERDESVAGEMRIGELADRTGFTPDTIRYYETIGIMPEPARTSGGQRRYGEQDLERLGFVRQAQTLGLTLDEIAEILLLVDDDVEPCEHVETRLRERLAEVEERIEELTALRRRLTTALRHAAEHPGDAACRYRIIEGATGERRIRIRGPGGGR